MQKLVDVDTFLGPEMKSTGEVMGVDHAFPAAVRKAMIASGLEVTPGTPFLLSVSNQTKAQAAPLIRALHDAGCRLYATEGTATLIQELGVPVEMVPKRLDQGHPNVVDVIRDGTVRAVINTIEGGRADVRRDGFHIRRAATEFRIPCFTSLDTAAAAIGALSADGTYNVLPLAEYRDGVPTPASEGA
jgi:carbamoyl-phosphate synthase large subunit